MIKKNIIKLILNFMVIFIFKISCYDAQYKEFLEETTKIQIMVKGRLNYIKDIKENIDFSFLYSLKKTIENDFLTMSKYYKNLLLNIKEFIKKEKSRPYMDCERSCNLKLLNKFKNEIEEDFKACLGLIGSCVYKNIELYEKNIDYEDNIVIKYIKNFFDNIFDLHFFKVWLLYQMYLVDKNSLVWANFVNCRNGLQANIHGGLFLKGDFKKKCCEFIKDKNYQIECFEKYCKEIDEDIIEKINFEYISFKFKRAFFILLISILVISVSILSINKYIKKIFILNRYLLIAILLTNIVIIALDYLLCIKGEFEFINALSKNLKFYKIDTLEYLNTLEN